MPMKRPNRKPKDHTFILPSKPLGGWIKMKSFNPSVDTMIPSKDPDELLVN